MHVYIYIKNYADVDSDVLTRSRNTRNYTLRRVPSSLGSNNVCIYVRVWIRKPTCMFSQKFVEIVDGQLL